jgi:hypothetical protein
MQVEQLLPLCCVIAACSVQGQTRRLFRRLSPAVTVVDLAGWSDRISSTVAPCKRNGYRTSARRLSISARLTPATASYGIDCSGLLTPTAGTFNTAWELSEVDGSSYLGGSFLADLFPSTGIALRRISAETSGTDGNSAERLQQLDLRRRCQVGHGGALQAREGRNCASSAARAGTLRGSALLIHARAPVWSAVVGAFSVCSNMGMF